ncbi:hypothetical protein K2Y11_15200 [bacterium]|nr:hypothetical protein [bacterium]
MILKFNRRRQGFVILFALGILLYGTTTLGLMAVKGAGRALDVRNRAEGVARDWALRTAEKSLLILAPRLLIKTEDTDKGKVSYPTRSYKADWKLGNLTLHIIVNDENAKLNLNQLHSDRSLSPEKLSDALRLATQAESIGRSVLARPLSSSAQQAFRLASFVNMDQLVDAKDLSPGIERFDNVTLWGSGKINIRTTTGDVLRSLPTTRIPVTDLRRLQALTSGPKGMTLNAALDKLEMPPSNRRWIESRFTDRSNTYSVHLTAKDQWATEYRFSVATLRSSGKCHRLSQEVR